jgi:hypothetical protein
MVRKRNAAALLNEMTKERPMFSTTFFVILVLLYLIHSALKRMLPPLFKTLELEVRCLLHRLPIEDRGEDRALEHLTEEQWQKHSLAYSEFLYGVGKYRKFNKGTSAWFEAEGLPPSPYLASLEKKQ